MLYTVIGNILLNLSGGYVSSYGVDIKGVYNNSTSGGLKPPSIVFPIAWSILYILLGVASGVIIRDGDDIDIGLYYSQLALNFIWTPLYFGVGNKTITPVIILSMVVLTLVIMKRLMRTNVWIYLLPYILWLCFALYLNLSL